MLHPIVHKTSTLNYTQHTIGLMLGGLHIAIPPGIQDNENAALCAEKFDSLVTLHVQDPEACGLNPESQNLDTIG